MTNPLGSPGAQQGMKTFKVSVPEAAYQELEKQAHGLGISVKQHAAPVLVAVARGDIKAQYLQPSLVPLSPPEPVLGTRERLLRIPRLTPACRAVLGHVLESTEAAGGKCVVDTNQELAGALGFSARAMSGCVGLLEAAGWLRVKLHAGGANGRQIWPTEKLRALCTP